MGFVADGRLFNLGGDPFSIALACEVLGLKTDARDSNVVYVVGRIEPLPTKAAIPCPTCHRGTVNKYHIQAIAVATVGATAEEVAVSMCRDENYFVGPMVVNACLPHEVTHWPGAYFPLRHIYDPYEDDEAWAASDPEPEFVDAVLA